MKTFTCLLTVLIILFVVSCSTNPVKTIDTKSFANPPATVGVHTWWHWLDGNITKEGITKDLEAMKEQGIVQATVLNVGLFGDRDFGIRKVPFNSPEWFEMFRWALQEANRLGISIGAHNCDGWSTSGGPWITPEMSMKQFIWTKALVDPGSNEPLKLLQPQANEGFYKDVAVVAYRTDVSINSFQNASPIITKNDKEFITPFINSIEFIGFTRNRKHQFSG